VPKVSEEHKQERRRQILEGARRAFAEYGYFSTNVGRLEKAIGLSRGAIFSYFPTKLELFLALAQDDKRALGETWLEHGFEGALRALTTDHRDRAGVYLDASRLLRSDPKLRERWSSIAPDVVQAIESRYRKQRQAGTIRNDVPLETVGLFLGCILDGLAIQSGAGYLRDVDVSGLVELVRAALAPPDAT
jgi:TetR/AcrR family transcriptional regulator, transcriptional repressor of aconitase